MAKTRPDVNVSVTFNKIGGTWGHFAVTFEERLDDGVFTPITVSRTESFSIADLPPAVKASLSDAWDGMKAWRDEQKPIT